MTDFSIILEKGFSLDNGIITEDHKNTEMY